MDPEQFMWIWCIRDRKVPLLEGPWEDGVVLDLLGFGTSKRCACQAQSLLSLEQIILMRSLGCGSVIGTLMPRCYTVSLGSGYWKWCSERHTEKTGLLLEKRQRKWAMPVLTTGQAWGDAGWGREEMKMRANRGCPVPPEWPWVWCVQNLLLSRNQTPTFPENIL